MPPREPCARFHHQERYYAIVKMQAVKKRCARIGLDVELNFVDSNEEIPYKDNRNIDTVIICPAGRAESL